MTTVTIIRKPQVRVLTGLGDSTIRRLVQAGNFPKPIQISPRAVGWRQDQVVAWVDSRPLAASGPAISPQTKFK
jgi:prophage regulatory protein